jgi:hypothetical protein
MCVCALIEDVDQRSMLACFDLYLVAEFLPSRRRRRHRRRLVHLVASSLNPSPLLAPSEPVPPPSLFPDYHPRRSVNQVGDDGAKALADSLQGLTGLETLELA